MRVLKIGHDMDMSPKLTKEPARPRRDATGNQHDPVMERVKLGQFISQQQSARKVRVTAKKE
jgi:hypothetical protein